MEEGPNGNPICRLAEHEIQAGCTAVVTLISGAQINMPKVEAYILEEYL